MIHNNGRNYFSKKLVYFKGSNNTNTVDEAYNARMATIGEAQQGMAEEYFNFYKSGTGGAWEENQVETKAASTGTRRVSTGVGQNGETQYRTESYEIPAEYETKREWVADGSTAGYQTMEQAQIDSNMEMIPIETAYNKEELALKTQASEAARELLPGQTALAQASNDSSLKLLPGQTALASAKNTDMLTAIGEKALVRNAFYKASEEGVDVEGRTNRAGADAAHAFAGSQKVMRRGAARTGVNPNSAKFASMTNTNALNRAKTISGARTKARTGAKQENYQRLTNAMGY